MDWLEERAERLQRYIRDLSFRKAMIAYILVLSVVVFGLSYLTIIVCWQWELAEWMRYERVDLSDLVYRKGPLWGFHFHFAEGTDYRKILFLDVIRVWCPYFYA